MPPAERTPGEPAADESGPIEGYVPHTGEGRSPEDVTLRDGTAPILERGEGSDDTIADAPSHSIPTTSNAPD